MQRNAVWNDLSRKKEQYYKPKKMEIQSGGKTKQHGNGWKYVHRYESKTGIVKEKSPPSSSLFLSSQQADLARPRKSSFGIRKLVIITRGMCVALGSYRLDRPFTVIVS